MQHALWALVVGSSASPLQVSFLNPAPRGISSCCTSLPCCHRDTDFFSGCQVQVGAILPEDTSLYHSAGLCLVNLLIAACQNSLMLGECHWLVAAEGRR